MPKYHGVLPAFYAAYGEDGNISVPRVKALAKHLLQKGVNGLYVNGSSGECIYLNPEERKTVLTAVMEEVGGKIPVIAHVACNNTRDSRDLAAHAQSVGADAIAAIPPIYFHLPDYAIAEYWNDISAAAPDTDFVIYNIPQLAGVALTVPLLREMLKNPRVVAVKNSSMPTQDIQMFCQEGGQRLTVFNGPDEQFLAGRAIGAQAGIGGTYAVMPELFIKLNELFEQGAIAKAQPLQYAINEIIYALCACRGNLYASMKKVMFMREQLEIGSVRKPLFASVAQDQPQLDKCAAMIDEAIHSYCK
ncbi:MAG: dihydrodipicolinate synthase family protein [Clostridia bacterium]